MKKPQQLDACPYCAGPPARMIRDAVTAKPFTGLSASAADKPDYLAALIFCHECGAEGPTIEHMCSSDDDVYALQQQADAAWNVRNTRNADLYQSAITARLTVPSIHTRIEPAPDSDGCWIHPGMLEPANGNEFFQPGEFERWLKFNLLEYRIKQRDDENQPNCIGWTPERPEDDGWFIAAIYDGEDGPECIWLRKTEPQTETETPS